MIAHLLAFEDCKELTTSGVRWAEALIDYEVCDSAGQGFDAIKSCDCPHHHSVDLHEYIDCFELCLSHLGYEVRRKDG